MFKKSRHKAKKLLLAFVITTLVGCNGSSDDGNMSLGKLDPAPNQPSYSSAVLSAENSVSLSESNSSTHVLLSGKIHSTTSEGTNSVSSVIPITELQSCQDMQSDPTGYSVNFDDFVGVCVYQYYGENSSSPEQKVSAYSILVAQQSESNELQSFEPLSETVLLDEDLVVDLKNELSATEQIPSGYSLSEDITLIGEGEASVNTKDETITYTPGAEFGFSKIIYSYTNGHEVKLGTIEISVSASANTAPNVPDRIDYSEDEDADPIYVNQKAIIDLSEYVSDDDEDQLQLIYTDSWNATVSPCKSSTCNGDDASEDMNNLKLEFLTSMVGEHIISYTISDHFGGYANGQLRVEAYDKDSLPTWGNLQQNTKYFFAPLVKSEADAQNAAYTSTHIDTAASGANVATFSLQQAKNLCDKNGRLPTNEELKSLSNIADIGPHAYDGWPVEVDYWALDDTTATYVDLDEGTNGTAANAGGQYVTCVGEGGYYIDENNSKLTAIGDGADKALVTVVAEFNGDPLKGAKVTADVDGSAVLESNTLTTDDNGKATFKVTDAVSEAVNFTTELMDSGVEKATTIQFTGNPNTAVLTLKSVTDNQPLAGTNVFESTLEDANGSPVVGQTINYEKNDDLTYTPASNVTDQQGKQSVSVSLVNQGSTSYPYTVTASYDRPDGSSSDATLPMKFTATKLNKSLVSVIDNSPWNEYNEVQAKFSQNPDGAVVKFEITEGNALFENNSKTYTVATYPNQLVTEVLKIHSGGKPGVEDIEYKVKASLVSSGQTTDELTQHFAGTHLPICGSAVNDSDQSNAKGYCLKVATDDNGYWFTSSPSIEVMTQLGYSTSNISNNTGDTYASTTTETGLLGPTDGVFALLGRMVMVSLAFLTRMQVLTGSLTVGAKS